jgi:ubiquinone/menaquinone biosynthesis C-methylase UbiE
MNKKEILKIFNDHHFVDVYLEWEAATRSYESHYQRLVENIPLHSGERVLDVGASQGSPSQALFKKQSDLQVVAVEPCENVFKIAKAVFTGAGLEDLIRKYGNNISILNYLGDQYQECVKYSSQISFATGFAEDLLQLSLGKFNHVLASCALHWLVEPEKVFSNFYNLLLPNGTVAISSASWKYKPSHPNLDHEMRLDNEPFTRKFNECLDNLLGYQKERKKEQEKTPSQSWLDKKWVENLLQKTGFEIISYRELKTPLSFGNLLSRGKINAFLRDTSKLEKTEVQSQIVSSVGDAFAQAWREINPLQSAGNYYEISPYIIAIRKS